MKTKGFDSDRINKKKGKMPQFLKIIADDKRLAILDFLRPGERCVCEIFPALGLAQNLASSHLRIMLDFDLLKLRQEGKRNYYSINKKVLAKQLSSLQKFFRLNNQD